MESEIARARVIRQAGRIARAHLEEHPPVKFSQSFASEVSRDIVVGIDRCNDVDTPTGPIGDDFGELNRRAQCAPIVQRDRKLILGPQLSKIV